MSGEVRAGPSSVAVGERDLHRRTHTRATSRPLAPVPAPRRRTCRALPCAGHTLYYLTVIDQRVDNFDQRLTTDLQVFLDSFFGQVTGLCALLEGAGGAEVHEKGRGLRGGP